jgi:hypothetical protein
MIKEPQKINSPLQDILKTSLGSQLIALYDFGSPGEENHKLPLDGTQLIAIIDNQSQLHKIRHAFQASRQPNDFLPLIATPKTLARHLKLNPILAAHLAQHGRLCAGQAIEITPGPITTPEKISHWAHAALIASKALAPQLLPDREIQPTQQKLLQTANYLNLDPNPANPIETIAAIQARLAQQIADQPQNHWQIPAPTGAPPLVEALVAIYEYQDIAIFILPDWPPKKIRTYITNLDWTAVAASLKDQYNGLQITTASLFRLMLQYTLPADHLFKNYSHAWGINALAALEIPRRRVYLDLARFASQLEVQTFAQAYITAEDLHLNRLVHDYQNKLLNIQLRQELLSRLTSQPKTNPATRIRPPISLPNHDDSAAQKVNTLFQLFNWWANYYSEILNNN